WIKHAKHAGIFTGSEANWRRGKGEMTVNKAAADDYEEPVLCFSLNLRFFHPSMRAEELSQEFRLQPDIMWNVGEPCVAPNGVKLSGVRKSTYWLKKEYIYGKRAFFQAAVDTVARL